MEKHFKENEFETVMDALMEYLNCLPKSTVKTINLPRYRLLMKTASQLTDILRKTEPEGELNIELDDLLNIGSISVVLDLLTVEQPLAFADMICKADNFEVYPLTNGKIRIDITFQGVLKSLA